MYMVKFKAVCRLLQLLRQLLSNMMGLEGSWAFELRSMSGLRVNFAFPLMQLLVTFHERLDLTTLLWSLVFVHVDGRPEHIC